MTREEALKQIREWDFLNDEERAALETLIPELRESEDERIRKDIINLIYWLKGNPSLCSQYYNDRYDGMLAYLERQKESLHISETCKENADSFPDWKRSSDYPKEGCNVSLNGEIKKIQEWNEEDEEINRCICLALTDANEQRFKDFGTTLKDCLAWVKSRRPQWRPSKEQMDAILWEIQNTSERSWQRREMELLYKQLKKLM